MRPDLLFTTMPMKIAVPVWENRISPVFDVAGSLLLLEVRNGRETDRTVRNLSGSDPLTRVRSVVHDKADVLICGAISVPVRTAVESSGVRVVPNICGPVEDILAAFLNDTLRNGSFFMPGCGFRHRHGRGRNRR